MDGNWRMASRSNTALEACFGAGAPVASQEVVLAVLDHRDFARARTFIEGFDRWDTFDDFICERDGLHIGLSSGGQRSASRCCFDTRLRAVDGSLRHNVLSSGSRRICRSRPRVPPQSRLARRKLAYRRLERGRSGTSAREADASQFRLRPFSIPVGSTRWGGSGFFSEPVSRCLCANSHRIMGGSLLISLFWPVAPPANIKPLSRYAFFRGSFAGDPRSCLTNSGTARGVPPASTERAGSARESWRATRGNHKPARA